MSALTWIGVALVSGCGAIARMLVVEVVSTRLGRRLPFGTFLVNMSGAFVLGLATGLALTGNALILAGTAAIGSYTTFSTWMLESQRLAEERDGRAALVNILASLFIGLGAATLGRLLGAHL